MWGFLSSKFSIPVWNYIAVSSEWNFWFSAVWSLFSTIRMLKNKWFPCIEGQAWNQMEVTLFSLKSTGWTAMVIPSLPWHNFPSFWSSSVLSCLVSHLASQPYFTLNFRKDVIVPGHGPGLSDLTGHSQYYLLRLSNSKQTKTSVPGKVIIIVIQKSKSNFQKQNHPRNYSILIHLDNQNTFLTWEILCYTPYTHKYSKHVNPSTQLCSN